MPNLLPGSVLNFQLDWAHPAGRLIWAVLFTTFGLIWIMALMKRPAVKSNQTGPKILVGCVVAGSAMVLAGKTILEDSLTGDTLVPFGFMIAWFGFITGVWVSIMAINFKQLELKISKVQFFASSLVAVLAIYLIGAFVGRSVEPVAYIAAWINLFLIVTIITLFILQMPHRTQDATWAEAVFGATYAFIMMTMIYAIIPHEWITFATSYLGFTKDVKVSAGGEFVLQTWLNGQFWSSNTRLIPFEINLEIVQDHATIALYVITAWINILLFSAWQKRNLPVEEKVANEEEKPVKTSRFGRPLKNLKATRA